MPRGEKPLDAAESELGRFADGLRRLREKAGSPPYRELSTRAHYSAAALSEAAAGKKLPSLAVTLAYVVACEGDVTEWEQRWRAIAEPPVDTAEAPYAGLAAFTSRDADLFFGREKLTGKLKDLVGQRPFVAVFGASGSGKSSLLRAGLVPALTKALVCTPGVSPLDECAVRLAELTGESPLELRERLKDPAVLRMLAHDTTLVVDQFEEVFTLCGPEQRDWFVQALVNAPHVVIGVRADFYGHCARHPELVEAFDNAQLLVGPMTPDELRRAIVEPAQRRSATVESALVTRLVADVSGQAAALPLMSHALVETWRRRRGMTMTLAGYEEAGGIEHAVARTAEQAFDELSAEQQAVARNVFLRLVTIDDTKRRMPRHDLDSEVLDRLAASRLIVLDRDHVDLAHEALIRSWPRLRDWISEDRDAARARQHLIEAVAAWEAHGRDSDAVYRGVRLAQAQELTGLTTPERDFLAAGTRVERRRTRRLRALTAVLTVLVVVLAGAVLQAVDAARAVAEQRNSSLARETASEALRLAGTDPGAAGRLALAAYAVARRDETRDAVLSASAAQNRTPVPLTYAGPVVEFTPSGRSLITQDSAGAVWRWDGADRRPLPVEPGSVVRFSGDERRMFVSGGKSRGYPVHVQEDDRTLVTLPSFSVHGVDHAGDVAVGTKIVATGDDFAIDNRAHVWDLRGTPRETVLPTADVSSTAVSRDGRTVAVAAASGDSSALELWRVGGDRLAQWTVEAQHVNLVQLSDDGRVLAARLPGLKIVRLWRIDDTPHWWADLPEDSTEALDVEFGANALAVRSESVAQVWDLSGEQPRLAGEFSGFVSHVSSVRYRPDAGEFVAFDWAAQGVWTLRRDVTEARRQLCAQSGVDLTDEEWRRQFPDVERKPVC